MDKKKIEIIAIGDDKVFSVASIVISAEGDVYINDRKKGSDFHTSRHASGETHWKSTKLKISEKIRKGTPITQFNGIEFLGTEGFGLDSLPVLYKEYKIKDYDGIFCIDLRQYKDKAFNMSVAMLTEEGLPNLLTGSRLLEKRQICVFPECNPMLAIIVGSAKQAIDAKT